MEQVFVNRAPVSRAVAGSGSCELQSHRSVLPVRGRHLVVDPLDATHSFEDAHVESSRWIYLRRKQQNAAGHPGQTLQLGSAVGGNGDVAEHFRSFRFTGGPGSQFGDVRSAMVTA